MDVEELNEEGEAIIIYNVNQDSGWGRLSGCGSKARRVFVPENTVWADLNRSLHISSQHALVPKFFDGTKPAVVYHSFDKSLADCIQEWDRDGILPVDIFILPGAQRPIYKYISDEYFVLVKGIFNLVIDMHVKDEKSMGRYELDDWLIIGGEPHFCGPTIPVTNETRDGDFHFLEVLFRGLFDDNCPDILIDLFDKMRAGPDANKEKSLKTHPALLSTTEKLEYIKNCDDKKFAFARLTSERANYEDAIKGFGVHTGWTDKFLDANAGTFGPITACFLYGYKPGKRDNYTGQGSQKVVNASLVRFLRNLASHLRSHLRKCMRFREVTDECVLLSICERSME